MTELGCTNDETALDRIFRKSIPEPNSGCWLWLGQLVQGYGQIEYRGQRYGAHRLSYETFRGKVPEGLQIDHLCRTRCCVNPDHLEVVTPRENVLRGKSAQIRVTVCKNGHAMTADNVSSYVMKNGRVQRRCKACRRKVKP